ncbi:MAG TPA: S8 family serine peptidase, partial [Polyangiaceae bacterium]
MQWNDTEVRGEIDQQRLAIVLKNGSNEGLLSATKVAAEAGLRPEVLGGTDSKDKREALSAKGDRMAPSDRLLWVTAPDAYSRRKDLAERVARLDARVSPVFIGALGPDTLSSRFTVDPWVVDVHPIGIRTVLLLGHGVELERHWPVGGWFRARLTKPVDDFAEFAKSLRKMGRVSFRSYPLVLPVAAPTPDATEPKYMDGTQWNLARIRSPLMWSCGTGIPGVKVFVVDTGVVAWDPEIELDAASVNIDMDLGGGVYGGTGRPVGNDGHGTNAAGIIGAEAASTGIAGIAPECTLVSLRCLDGSITEVFQAVNYAVTQLSAGQRGVVSIGFDVLKLYANGVADASLLVSALNTAQAHDLTIVIPSGNYTNPVTEGDQIPVVTPLTAATKPYVITVGASIRNNANPSQEGRLDNTGGEPGSRYGAELSIVAPGTDIYSTTAPIHAYAGSLCGTCIAAAHVAGTAAIIRSLATGMTAPDVKTLLLATATQVTGA